MMRYDKIYGQCPARITLYGKQINVRRIVLPMPPSENDRLEPNFQALNQKSDFLGRYFNGSKKNKIRRRGGVLKNSTQYNSWLHAAATILKAGKFPTFDEPVYVLYTVVFPDRKLRDAPNREKAFLDALQHGGVYTNDNLVKRLFIEERIIKGKQFVHALVFPVAELPWIDLMMDQDYLNKVAEQI